MKKLIINLFNYIIMTMAQKENLVEKYHQQLPERVRKYLNDRGISDEIINPHRIGWNGQAITIPIFDMNGDFLFFKFRKDPEDTNEEKPKYWYESGSKVELYGWENLRRGRSPLIISEGEMDLLCLESKGFAAITSTGGAGTFKKDWIQFIPEDVSVFIVFDNDEAGRKGMRKIAEMIPRAKIVYLPSEVGENGDVTDYFVKLKKTPDEFRDLLKTGRTLDEISLDTDLFFTDPGARIHPSQDFKEDLGIFTIPFWLPDKESKTEILKQVFLVVTSGRRVLRLENKKEFYDKHGLLITDLPTIKNPEIRWQYELIKKYQGGYMPDPFEVFQTIKNVYERYIEFKDDEWYSVISLWLMGTYLYRIFEAYPYLALTGLKNTGKSKVCDLTVRMAFNGINSVGISEASLFRFAEAMRGTLAIDEGEQLKDPKKSQGLRELLNAGHRKGASVYREEKNRKDQFCTKRFEVYSPKIIANIQGLEDVLSSRAITVTMLRAKSERGSVIVTDTSENWNEIRHQLYSCALGCFQEIRQVYLNESGVKIANNRANDLWCPLLSIAWLVFKNKPELFEALKTFALKQVNDADEENLDDISRAVLLALRDLVIEDSEYTNKEIWEKTREYLNDDDEIKSYVIGYRLKKFGIKKKREGRGVKYFIKKPTVDDLIERYLPREDAKTKNSEEIEL